jgi:transporter family-2 protein
MLGGVGGAMFVAAQGLVVPTLGALFTVAVVAGQTGNSLVADRLGWAPAVADR